MTFLYDARYSFVLLRPKNEAKVPTHRAENRICMGKWALPSEVILFLRLQKSLSCSDFSGAQFATNAGPEK